MLSLKQIKDESMNDVSLMLSLEISSTVYHQGE